MQTSKTNFEQIPVAVVKKIAALFTAAGKTEDDTFSFETPAEETELSRPAGGAWQADGQSSEDWRDIAQRVHVEADSDKMTRLVRQLIEKLDEEKLRRKIC
jgi:hypothetical protein